MCVTLAGNESHPAVADEDKGLTDSKGSLRLKMLENVQKSSKTFHFFPKWVTMMDHSEPTRRLVSDAQECSRLFTRNWETKQKVLHQRQTAGSYGDNVAQTVMHHVVQCLKKWWLGLNKATEPHTTAAPWQHDWMWYKLGTIQDFPLRNCGRPPTHYMFFTRFSDWCTHTRSTWTYDKSWPGKLAPAHMIWQGPDDAYVAFSE